MRRILNVKTKRLSTVMVMGSLAGALLCIGTAKADLLTVGGVLTAPYSGAYVIPNATSPGTLVTSLTSSIVTTAFTATVREAVFNPGIANTLDYYFQVTNGAGTLFSDAIGRLTDRSFNAFTTNVFARTDASSTNALCPACAFLSSTLAPTSIDRDISGQTIGWNFAKGIAPTFPTFATSEILIVRVNSASFSSNGQFNAIDGAVGSIVSFAPQESTPPPPGIPEPASIILLGTGMLGLAFVARRRAISKDKTL
jgi:hypothetical protein